MPEDTTMQEGRTEARPGCGQVIKQWDVEREQTAGVLDVALSASGGQESIELGRKTPRSSLSLE